MRAALLLLLLLALSHQAAAQTGELRSHRAA
jgi:hypothetical protein